VVLLSLHPQSKVRAQLEREQEEINQLQDREYKQLQKNVSKYKKQLELQDQQEQHQRWAQLNIERQAHRKLSTVRWGRVDNSRDVVHAVGDATRACVRQLGPLLITCPAHQPSGVLRAGVWAL
jgi:hypothetical protein